jgi:hypothetical protein
MACLHLAKHQFPLCRGCETGARQEATVAFYQLEEHIAHLPVNLKVYRSRSDLISFSCDLHLSKVKCQLEKILQKHITQGRRPRWDLYIW